MANNYWENLLGKLIGGKVVGVIKDDSENEDNFGNGTFYGLQILMPDGKVMDMWFLSDEEGNGAGRPDIGEGTLT